MVDFLAAVASLAVVQPGLVLSLVGLSQALLASPQFLLCDLDTLSRL